MWSPSSAAPASIRKPAGSDSHISARGENNPLPPGATAEACPVQLLSLEPPLIDLTMGLDIEMDDIDDVIGGTEPVKFAEGKKRPAAPGRQICVIQARALSLILAIFFNCRFRCGVPSQTTETRRGDANERADAPGATATRDQTQPRQALELTKGVHPILHLCWPPYRSLSSIIQFLETLWIQDGAALQSTVLQ